jgi:hypothetical protein
LEELIKLNKVIPNLHIAGADNSEEGDDEDLEGLDLTTVL